jgi:hypothetical protein
MLPRARLVPLSFFAVLLFLNAIPTPGRAMDILLFARMNLDDQADYVTSMIEGAVHLLRAQGHPEQAERVVALFKDKSPNGGVHQLAQNLKDLQEANTRNGDNPNNHLPVYDVESAMELTLRHAGVEVPAKYLESLNRHFQPFYPLH